jgi:hypothetical protein
MMAAAFEGELGPLHDALTCATLPIFRGGAVDESPWPTEPTAPEHAPNFWQFDKTDHRVLAESSTIAAIPADAVPNTPALPVEQQQDLGC